MRICTDQIFPRHIYTIMIRYLYNYDTTFIQLWYDIYTISGGYRNCSRRWEHRFSGEKYHSKKCVTLEMFFSEIQNWKYGFGLSVIFIINDDVVTFIMHTVFSLLKTFNSRKNRKPLGFERFVWPELDHFKLWGFLPNNFSRVTAKNIQFFYHEIISRLNQAFQFLSIIFSELFSIISILTPPPLALFFSFFSLATIRFPQRTLSSPALLCRTAQVLNKKVSSPPPPPPPLPPCPVKPKYWVLK